MNRGSLHTLRHSRGWCSRIDLWNINVTNSIIDCLRPHRNYAHQETPPAQQTHWFPCPIFHTSWASPCRHDHNHDDPRCSVPCSRMHTIGPPSATSRAGRGVFFATASSCGVDKPSVWLVLWPLPRKYASRGVKLNFLKSWGQEYLQYPSPDRCTQLRTGVRLIDVVLNHIDVSFCFIPWFVSLLFP